MLEDQNKTNKVRGLHHYYCVKQKETKIKNQPRKPSCEDGTTALT